MAVDTEHANWRKNFKQNFRVLSNSKFYPVVCIFFFFFAGVVLLPGGFDSCLFAKVLTRFHFSDTTLLCLICHQACQP